MSGNKVILGLVLIFLGLFFLLTSMGVIDWDFGDLISFMWPVVLILIGVWFIFKRRRPDAPRSGGIYSPPPPPHHTDDAIHPAPPPPSSEPGPESTPSPGAATGSGQYHYKYTYQWGSRSSATADSSAGGRVKYSKFIGGLFIDCRNVDLHSIEVSVFMGDSEIKVHGGRLGPGLNRLIVSGFIGDVRILIPPDLPVLCTASSFIGDVELLGKRSSGLGNTIDARTDGYDSAESKLYIAINHFIGDIRVYVV
jgi:lia operon protein LiaF